MKSYLLITEDEILRVDYVTAALEHEAESGMMDIVDITDPAFPEIFDRNHWVPVEDGSHMLRGDD